MLCGDNSMRRHYCAATTVTGYEICTVWADTCLVCGGVHPLPPLGGGGIVVRWGAGGWTRGQGVDVWDAIWTHTKCCSVSICHFKGCRPMSAWKGMKGWINVPI